MEVKVIDDQQENTSFDLLRWTRKMLKLFSELLKTSRSNENEESAGMTAEAWQEFCNESSRVLEPVVRNLIK